MGQGQKEGGEEEERGAIAHTVTTNLGHARGDVGAVALVQHLVAGAAVVDL